MKNYKIIVNGTEYAVSIEEMKAGEAAPVKAATPAASPAAAPVSAPAGGAKINAPMPGTVLSVNVAVGDTVKTGQVLLVLEAMKMENEIVAPSDGKIVSVNTSKGAAVESGALLCVLG